MLSTDRCWCGHQARWHTPQISAYRVMTLCKWCARQTAKNQSRWKSGDRAKPAHELALHTPEWMMSETYDKLRRVAEAWKEIYGDESDVDTSMLDSATARSIEESDKETLNDVNEFLKEI